MCEARHEIKWLSQNRKTCSVLIPQLQKTSMKRTNSSIVFKLGEISRGFVNFVRALRLRFLVLVA